MKHNDIITDIKELTSLYLPFIIDVGFSVDVFDTYREVNIHNNVLDNINNNVGIDPRKYINIHISLKKSNDLQRAYHFGDIIDDLIPFLTILNDKYIFRTTLREKGFIGYYYKDYTLREISRLNRKTIIREVSISLK